jgi:hypothetical protein
VSGTEWGALALFAATALGLSFVDADMAVGFVVIVGLIIVVTTM